MRVSDGGFGHFGQRVRGKQIVLIHEGGEFVAGHVQGRVGCGGDVPVALSEFHADARVKGGKLSQQRADCGIWRSVVGHAQFPVGPGLGHEGVDGGP